MKLFTLFAGLSGLAAGSISQRPRQSTCNENAAFCDRKYSNVSLIGTHDSAFVGPILDPRVNQEENVTQQLDAGIRFLQAQTHVSNGELSMYVRIYGPKLLAPPKTFADTLVRCHTSCVELYAGSLQTYLSTVKSWLDGNPDNFLTMLLVNGDNVNATTFGDVFSTAGLADVAFVPSTSPNQLAIDDWPTYAELLSSGKRIVVFLDSGANESAVPYLLDEFTYFFETPYDTTDPSFPECTLDRPAGGAAEADGRMYIVNHFLDTSILGIDIPDDAADYTTNAATGNGSIGAQADLCTSMYDRVPNFVLVDMFDRGDVFTAQNTLNGV